MTSTVSNPIRRPIRRSRTAGECSASTALNLGFCGVITEGCDKHLGGKELGSRNVGMSEYLQEMFGKLSGDVEMFVGDTNGVVSDLLYE